MRALVIATILTAGAALASAQPVGTAFTYQGRLTDGGNPASGAYDLQLALFDAAAGGAQVGSTLTRDDVTVVNGLFAVALDFGGVFTGSKRWIEIRVRPGASTGAYTTLAGRQELTPSPNAAFASAVPWTGIAGKPAGFADDVDNDSGGDVTGVTAGTGLTGGGTSGGVTLNVDLGGSGSATTVARSDHDHTHQSWSAGVPGQAAFRVANTASGGFSDGIWGQGDAVDGARGVVGYAAASAGTNYGVWGQADSTGGRGVFGLATAPSGVTYGVYGEAVSSDGYAGYFPGRVAAGALTIGGGTPVLKILSTTATWDFSVLSPGGFFTIDTPLPGAALSDSVLLSMVGTAPFPCAYGAWVQSPNLVRLILVNQGETNCDAAPTTYRFTILRF